MKKYIGMAMAFAGLASMAQGEGSGINPDSINAGGSVPPAVPKGLTLFVIDGVEVWALNRKNAIRKVRKKQ